MRYPENTTTALDAERVATLGKALGHPARVQIVELLSQQHECSGAEVFSELPLAQSTISEHLRVLKQAGLVNTSRCGTGTVYCINQSALDELAAAVGGLSGLVSACCSPGGTC
jgi:ArsR family transcriptional regulator